MLVPVRAVGLTAARVPGKNRGAACSQQDMTVRIPHEPRMTGGPPSEVVQWRRRRLLEHGFPLALAGRLARQAVDLHALLELVDRGCPPDLAARILAPVDEAG